MTWKIFCFLLFWADHCVAERYTVYWNRSNPTLLAEGFTLAVRLNDYLDILCPHYAGPAPALPAEEYTLYLVEEGGYRHCRVGSKEQVRWECRRPRAPHGPERFSEKFQRFTPFSLGKEFREGKHYHYISKPVHRHQDRDPCLRLRVHVLNSKRRDNGVDHYTTKAKFSADQPPEELPDTQRSTGDSAALMASPSLAVLLWLLPLML